jgi:hypothetical protein
VSSGIEGRAEVLSPESVTGRAPGMSEAAMKGQWNEAIGSGAGGQEAEWMPKGRARFVTIAGPHSVGA